MKFLFIFLTVLIVTAALTLLALNEPGYVLLGVGKKAVQMPLLDFVVLLSALFVLFYIFLTTLLSMRKAPHAVKVSLHNGQVNKARRGLTTGLLALAEGNWSEAEKLLSSSAKRGETPVLNYLAAAHSAEHQHKNEARDNYLRLAAEVDPGAEVVVGLTQAELQTKKGQNEEALATLQSLKDKHPRHSQVQKQLAEQLLVMREWQQLSDLLPEIKKNKSISDAKKIELETQTWTNLISEAGEARNRTQLDKLWKNLNKAIKGHPEILAAYCQQLIALKDSPAAERLLRKSLNTTWDNRLVKVYGNLQMQDPSAAIKQSEKWLRSNPESAELLAAAGRLNTQGKIWGKAKNLLEESIQIKPTPDSYQAMAELLEALGENEAAKMTYQKGLKFATQHNNVNV